MTHILILNATLWFAWHEVKLSGKIQRFRIKLQNIVILGRNAELTKRLSKSRHRELFCVLFIHDARVPVCNFYPMFHLSLSPSKLLSFLFINSLDVEVEIQDAVRQQEEDQEQQEEDHPISCSFTQTTARDCK